MIPFRRLSERAVTRSSMRVRELDENQTLARVAGAGSIGRAAARSE